MLCVVGAGIYVVLREDRLYAEKTGFVCPVCGKSLYFSSDAVQKSALITKGLCPRCKADVVGILLGEEGHSER
jgi:transcription initiation factor IIE alpha subunit